VYRIRFWTTDFAADEILRDAVRSRVYYAFRRHQIVIPYPIQVEMHRIEPVVDEARALTHRAAALHATPIFAPLDARTIEDVARGARLVQFGAHETIVREGQAGESMFVVAHGEARVMIAGASGATEEVARLKDGAFFGEMSLLTGDPRTATVVAVTDCDLFELPAVAFREIVAKNPAIVEMVTDAVTRRREELGRHRAAAAASATPEEPAHRILARIRSFLRLSPAP
jgi:CRP-like cAMP-binding protein